MKSQKSGNSLRLIVKTGLFLFILGLGITITLLIGETSGLALADLSQASIRAITTSPNGQVLYVALNGNSQSENSQLDGLYRSDNNGRTWQFTGSGPGAVINVLVMHPTNEAVLFAGSAGGPLATTNNLWRSDDAGQTWRKFFLSLPAHPDGLIPAVTALAVDPNQPQTLYVGTDGQGVYRFDVGLDGLGYSLVGGVSFHDLRIKDLGIGLDGQVYALTEDKLFASIEGADWQELTLPPETPHDLAIAATEPGTLYILAFSGTVYRSLDGGQNWERIGGDWWAIPAAELQGTALTVSKLDAHHVVISTAYEIDKRMIGGNIYETYDAGQNWAKIAEANGVVTHLIIADDAIYAAAPNGLVRYREPVEPGLGDGLYKLTNLTEAQLLALLITVGLAGLIALGRMEWILKLERS